MHVGGILLRFSVSAPGWPDQRAGARALAKSASPPIRFSSNITHYENACIERSNADAADGPELSAARGSCVVRCGQRSERQRVRRTGSGQRNAAIS